MKYPVEIEKILPDIQKIISKWPAKKNLEEVITWMLQFDNEDFDFAYRILKNLNIIGPEELNSALAISYSKLIRRAKSNNIDISLKNTMYAAIGGASKSGAMVAYNFRLINELSSANFLDEDSIQYIIDGNVKNLVLIDDIIATGDQAAKELTAIAETVIPLGVKNLFVLTAVGMKSGIQKVQDTQLAEVFSALEYDEQDTLLSLDSTFYEGLSYHERKTMQEKITKYRGRGYDGMAALITFFYNTPNCTIKAIWSDRDGWIPLFSRVSGVNGIDKHYPKLEKAIRTISSTQKDQSSLTIFVEGKYHEILFENLANKFNNFDFDKLDCISIGPFYSEKFINSLDKIANSYVLITEDEGAETPHSKQVKEIVKANKLIIMDRFYSYIDIDKLKSDEQFLELFNNDYTDNDPDIIGKQIYLKLIKHASPSNREENIKTIVDNFLIESKIAVLIESIKNKVHHLPGTGIQDKSTSLVPNDDVGNADSPTA